MTAADQRDGIEALSQSEFIDDAVLARLRAFVDLLRRWQKAHNLVSARTLDEVWIRHIMDSLQLVPYAPPAGRWIDLGSGAGFPGLVAAIALVGRPTRFTLVESNGKKCAFLRAAGRETGTAAEIACMRIEDFARTHSEPPDVISARALAPFPRLCALAAPLMGPRTTLLLLKGREFAAEEKEAAQSWDYDLLVSPSRTDSSGQIVAVRNLKPKGA
ncbi:MAG TPA: 16S rRNA (guanine(527)-N(7))-methyltransferase RsmG [Afifellaceae bacterium]|nr:16S rRNA (guanine(527)-N(7))-methyltransferase RsmG [Afifellaceae bacterium]